MRTTALALFALAAGCGYTDAGSGTETLLVDPCDVTYVVENNRLDVDLRLFDKAGNDVDDADVMLTDDDTDTNYRLSSNGNRYRAEGNAEIPGYHRRLALAVTSGADELEAKLESPGPHIVTEPEANRVYDRSDLGGTLDIQWATDDGLRADEVSIELTNRDTRDTEFERIINDDTGSFNGEVDTGSLPAGQYELRVVRTNKVTLAGGRPGSVFRLAYEVTNQFTIRD